MAEAGRRKAAATRKSERIELRVTRSAKALIQRACDLSGLAAGDLALEAARRLLDEHEHLVLRGADRDAFLKAVVHSPPPSPSLVAALRRHRAVVG